MSNLKKILMKIQRIEGSKKCLNLSRIASMKASIEVEAGWITVYADRIYYLTFLQGIVLLRLLGCSEQNTETIMSAAHWSSKKSYYLHW
jgi:hypothetical protein